MAVLAATVLATLGLLGALSSTAASGVDEAQTGDTVAAGIERPGIIAGLAALATDAESPPNLEAGASDLEPPPDAMALVALAVFTLALGLVGRARRAAGELASDSYLGGVEHVPRPDLMGQLRPDSPGAGSPCHRPPSPLRITPASPDVEASRCRPHTPTVRPSCRAVLSRVRAQVGHEPGGRATTYADRGTACAGASPDGLPRAVPRSRGAYTGVPPRPT